MALDPRRLKPAELVRLLNSNPQGHVLDDRMLRAQRSRAGFRVGDEKTIDLFRYVAWLWAERIRKSKPGAGQSYEAKKEQARQRSQDLVASGQDIGELPPVKDPARRAACERNFRLFCETYLSLLFFLTWSRDHLKVIAKIETAVLKGGLFAMAMPRGAGKTRLVIAAAIWSLLYGHHEFVCLIGATEALAQDLLNAIRAELDGNERLLEDFPEVCFPIRQLEGINQRRLRYHGQVIDMEFTAKRIVLPNLPDSAAASGIVRVVGLTGALRGMAFSRPDGRTVRPSLVIVDDPQTRKSAKSPTQSAERERILAGDVLGLAGPGQKISGLMPCTVIYPGDMADNILDRQKHPDWNGERTKMLYAFPKNETLWEEYARLRAEGLREGDAGQRATEFYAANRAHMDEGADVAWPERFDPGELSGLQNAMNLKLRDEQAFWAEYQNEPVAEQTDADAQLSADDIAAKMTKLPRGKVPLEAQYLAAFIDVMQNALYYAVVGWSETFAGQVIDYGTYPDQKRWHFAYGDVKQTLRRAHPGKGMEATILAGLTVLTKELLDRDWPREGGSPARIGLCLIDANWQTDNITKWCRDSAHAALIRPARGEYKGASSKGLNERKKQPGDLPGLNWLIPAASKRDVRQVRFETNFWKSFLQARLAAAPGESGCLSLFAGRSDQHRLISEHLTAEFPVTLKAKGSGREVQEWKPKPGRDNHWLDCLVGCCVAGSVLGAELIAAAAPRAPPKRKSLADLRRARARK